MTQDPITESEETLASIIIWPEDGKEMVFVQGGTFIMGSNNGDANHQPEHRVEVADYYIDRWPVTNTEYKKFIDATGHAVPNYHVSWCDTEAYNWDPDNRTPRPWQSKTKCRQRPSNPRTTSATRSHQS